MQTRLSPRTAFSLVELSIVLVILGLLVGGILAGKSLIRASELRSVIGEQGRYITAIHTFRDKYFYLPGDMPNATAVWTTATNGNGDGAVGITKGIGIYAANGTQREWYKAWDHLAKAGLIEGSYTGDSGPAHTFNDTIKGTNVPNSKLTGAGWCFENGYNAIFTLDQHNSLSLSAATSGGAAYCRGDALIGEEAWNIDTKLDDGMPGNGKVIAAQYTTCTTASGATDFAATYNFANSCSLAFIKSF